MSRRNPMPDSTDAPIKLFGRSIQLPDSNSPPPASAVSDSLESGSSSLAEPSDGCAETRKKDVETGAVGESPKDGTSSDEFQQHEDMKNKDAKGKDQQAAESDSGSEEKALKKPDKILPCPRCNSMETKFCYFNNYNVNQPRHFCKSCQRYWTAGGTIRNVPVGAGRRKNKQISSPFQPLAVSPNAGPLAHVNLLSPTDPRCLSPTGLGSPTFAMEPKEVRLNGNDSSLCRSVTASLSLQDQTQTINNPGTALGRMTLPPPSGTSAPSAAMTTEGAVQMGQVGSSASHVPPLPNLQGYPGPPAYPWNMGWTGMAYGTTDNGQAVLVPWGLPPMAAVPRFCGPTPGGVIPLVPSPYWTWDPSAWNGQPTGNLSPSSSAGNSSCSGNTSPLGKHLRDLDSKADEATEKSLWVPKTLRIDDPDEAAKSSIWTTLGIKPGEGQPFSKSGPTKDFLRKYEGDAQKSGGNKMLQANPAALSRFHAFQEST